MKSILIFISILGITGVTLAQEAKEQIQRANTIKLEFSQALYPNSFIMAYERVTRPNQTFCLIGGYEEFPNLVDLGDNIKVNQTLEKGGFKLGAEYRFYLKKENKNLAPHGVYIGPYFSYHDFNYAKTIEVEVDGAPEVAGLNTDFSITNLGFELGYQFVFGSRWTLDLVAVGPSVSRYNARLRIDGDFTFDEEDIKNEILQKLIERFPMLGDVLTDKEVSSKGTLDSWAYGWRYQFLVGYHFGRKKN